jgi:hypothetical protein
MEDYIFVIPALVLTIGLVYLLWKTRDKTK